MQRLNSGQSLLALVVLIGGIVAGIAITMAFSTNSFLTSSGGFSSASLADSAASAGAQDALLNLDRNAGFSSGGYSLVVGSTTATVSVTQNSPSTNFITIFSQATVNGSTRRVNVILLKNSNTNQFNIVSWQEI